MSASIGHLVGGDVLADGCRVWRSASLSFMRTMRPRISERSMGSTEMPLASSSLLAVAHGVERRRARADGADAQAAQAAHHAADGGEPVEILGEDVGIGSFGVQRGQRVRNAVLLEVVAGRHLAAEAVAAVADGHQSGRVGRGLHQHGHVEVGQAQRVGDGALVAEIRQRDDDAVDLVAVALEEVGADGGLRCGFRWRRTWFLPAPTATTP